MNEGCVDQSQRFSGGENSGGDVLVEPWLSGFVHSLIFLRLILNPGLDSVSTDTIRK